MKYILKIIGFFSVSFYIISKIVYASDWVQLSETDSAIHYIQKKPEKTKSPNQGSLGDARFKKNYSSR